MPELPAVSGREVARALQRAGFEQVRVVGSHATFINHETGARTTVPLWNKDLRTGTLRRILSNAKLTVAEFRAFLK